MNLTEKIGLLMTGGSGDVYSDDKKKWKRTVKTAVMVLLSVIAIVIVLALIFLAIGVSPVTGLWKIVTTSFGSGMIFQKHW